MFPATRAVRPETRASSGGRGRVHVDADAVHAILHHRVEGAREFPLGQIVLVLPDPMAFGSIFTSSASGS